MAFALQAFGHLIKTYSAKKTSPTTLAAQQDAVKDGCTINATSTKSSSQSKESSTNDARPPDNSLILTETSFTPRQDKELDPEPSTSRLARSTLNLVSPYDTSPVSNKKRKSSNRGRKATVTEVITSSPYKNQLIDSNKMRVIIKAKK